MSEYCVTEEYFVSTKSGGKQMPSMHYHNSYELYYLDAGSREYFVGDELFSVCAGEFVLIPPMVLHRTGGEYGTRILVGFTENFLLAYFTKEAASKLLKCFAATKRIPNQEQRESLRLLLKKLAACQEEADFAIILGMLLQELGQCGCGEFHAEPVSAIVNYINNHYNRITQIEQIAEQFYISKFHLCRVFKASMQMTVVDYLNQIRIKNACGFLRSTTMSISEISTQCGFNSPAYFSNVFKKVTGVAPAEYRKKSFG